MPEIRYCRTADGANLAYTIRGKGPPIIFVPSFISIAHGLGEAFEPLAEQLSRSTTVVAYDGRGMGLSDRNQVDYSLEARLADLQAIVDQTDAARVSIVARLYGVPTAIQFTASSPDRVDRLLLFGGYADGKRYYEESEFGQLADALRNVTDQQWQFVSQTMVARGAIPGTPVDILDKRAAAMREDWTPHSLLAFREGNRAINVTDSLPLIQTPTMVVTISGGGSSILNYAREMASAIPRARLIQSKASWNAIDDETLHQSLEFLGVSDAVAPRSVQEPPSFRTILFTDLVGHTEMMSRLGDVRGRDVLREHESITREVLKANGGTEVKTMGDGFMASFGSVTRAVECAVSLQCAFAEREGEPLSVRVGLNAGEPIEEDGDLFGATVILASRIAAKASAGEILVSDNVRSLSAGKSFLFSDRGEFVAKGFEDPVRVYEVNWRD